MSVPGEVLAIDWGSIGALHAYRMGCLKGGVLANRVAPTADYVRVTSYYGF